MKALHKKLNISLLGALLLALLMLALPLAKGLQQADVRQARYALSQATNSYTEDDCINHLPLPDGDHESHDGKVLLSQQSSTISVAHFQWPLPYSIASYSFFAPISKTRATIQQALCVPAALAYYLTLMRCIISPQAP